MNQRPKPGFTLIEIMISMAVIAVAALGTLGYQYHAVKQSRIANAQIAATKIAQLVLEDWKSTGAGADYDPTALQLDFTTSNTAADDFGFGDDLGAAAQDAVYDIAVDGFPMQLILKYRDVATDSVAQITLRQITVIVKFTDDAGADNLASTSLQFYNPGIVLTTYARLDGAGG